MTELHRTAPAPPPSTTDPTRPASRASSPARRRSATSTASTAASVPRLPDRRPRRARHVPGRREPAVDRRVGSRATASRPGRSRPRSSTVLRALPAVDEADGRAAHRGLGLGRDPGPAVAADRRAGPGAHRRSRRRRWRRSPASAHGKEPIEPDPSLDLVEGFLYQLTGDAAGRRHGPGARRLLHRRRRARLQRLDVHRPGHHLDPLGHRVGGHRRDRHDEGAAPRRRAVGGRRPAARRSARSSTPRSGSATRSTAASG